MPLDNWKRLLPDSQPDNDIVIYRVAGDLIWIASGFIGEAGTIVKWANSDPVALGPGEVHELDILMRGVYNGG